MITSRIRSSASKGCIPHTKTSLFCASLSFCIAKLRHKRIAYANGSVALLIVAGFILLGEVRGYMQRGFMQSLHLTTPRRNFVCINLFVLLRFALIVESRYYSSVTSPMASRLLSRLRFCKEGWWSSVKGCKIPCHNTTLSRRR